MRLAFAAAMLLAAGWLAGCDEAPAPEATVEPAGAGDAALQSAAKKECAELTNYLPEKIQAMTPEMRALTEREYNLCVSKVGSGN